jgi:hypothetical protein
MDKLVIKSEGKLWPTIILGKTRLMVYYLGEKPDDVSIKQTNGIDFDELLLYIDKGGSVFITSSPYRERMINSEDLRRFDECSEVMK